MQKLAEVSNTALGVSGVCQIVYGSRNPCRDSGTLSSVPSRLNLAEMLRKADEVCDATGIACSPAFLGTDNAAIAAYVREHLRDEFVLTEGDPYRQPLRRTTKQRG